MEIDITERLNLERECKKNNLSFREETNLDGLYYCKASITFYLAPEMLIKCQNFCPHLGDFYRKQGRTHGHYLCNYVPKKNNS